MVLMRFFTSILVWVSLFVAGLSLIGIALLLQNYHHEFWGGDGTSGTINPGNILAKSETVGDVLQYFVYILYGLTGLYFLIMLCLVRQIFTSIKVLETSAYVIAQHLRIILVPFIGGIIFFLWIGLWLISFGLLVSTADIKKPTDGT